MKQIGFFIFMAAWAALCELHAAELKLVAVFSDHMVLQRDVPVPVWGTATPGERVTVEFAPSTGSGQGGQKKTATADANGKWLVKLDPLKASAEPGELRISSAISQQPCTIKDVLVGEVWLCGGQSNMERQLGPRPPQPLIQYWEQEVATAQFPHIRHFGVAHKAAKEPVADVTGSWVVCSPETVKDFTAVGYFFGRELHRELKVPIGLLHSSWGGTGVATWTSKDALDKIPEVTAALAAELQQPKVSSKTPTILFQSMIAPLIPFAIKGAIWFQGESGAGLPVAFDTIFQALIADWRTHWGLGNFPFYFVQLPNGSPLTREAQARALQLPNTGMAVGIDVGDKDVHGPIKAPLGERLARLALTQTYGRSGEASGPLFQSAAVEGASIRVRFTHLGGGLVTSDGGPLKHFSIAGADQKFVAAEAKIEGDTVVVSCATVARPVSVRYAWVNVATGANLFNQAGLPAAPFRTDAASVTPGKP
ncbi:MAG: sialate O-acetylesterase [Kiritimatiellaeota bacterium]|nr:sialate O-acetylesterase [Kiritimatiellota bacterium]